MTITPKRAVVLEDDTSTRTLLELVLQTEGWEYISGSTIEDVSGALRWASVLLLDHHLTGMAGLDVLARIRDLGLGVAVVMLTADPVARERAELLGVERFLLKPFDVPELLGILDALAARSPAPVVDLRGAVIDGVAGEVPSFVTH